MTKARHFTDEGGISPIAVTIPEAVRMSGMSRSAIYLRIREGAIDARKAGGRTLIMADSLEKYIKSLPQMSSAGSMHAPGADTLHRRDGPG